MRREWSAVLHRAPRSAGIGSAWAALLAVSFCGCFLSVLARLHFQLKSAFVLASLRQFTAHDKPPKPWLLSPRPSCTGTTTSASPSHDRFLAAFGHSGNCHPAFPCLLSGGRLHRMADASLAGAPVLRQLCRHRRPVLRFGRCPVQPVRGLRSPSSILTRCARKRWRSSSSPPHSPRPLPLSASMSARLPGGRSMTGRSEMRSPAPSVEYTESLKTALMRNLRHTHPSVTPAKAGAY
jgi:hypothetical protein